MTHSERIKADVTARLQNASPRYARILRGNLEKQQARDRAAAELAPPPEAEVRRNWQALGVPSL